jgi:flavin reductase (DIM6/NTAB) family NADH-FMN oxidoreductase RutF
MPDKRFTKMDSTTTVSPPSGLDARQLRRTLGQFATGIAVLTTRAPDGAPLGLTINSFNSVSLEPPLVVFSLARRLSLLPWFEAASHFGISLLSAEQRALSDRFAGPAQDRFAGVEWFPGPFGSPLLVGACAHFECRNAIRHDGGDHLLFLAEVCHHAAFAREPLVFFGGAYRELAL